MPTNKYGKRIPQNYCSCGAVVNGNGAWVSHKKRHKRLDDGHRPMTLDQFNARAKETK